MESMILKPKKELKTVMFIIWVVVMIIGIASLTPPFIFIPEIEGKLVFGILLVIFLTVMVLFGLWIPAFFKSLEYCIDSEAVRMKKGVFWKRRVTVPYDKITNVDISQGPLERKYDIGKIHVQTAGAGGAQGAQAELRISGARDLEKIKDIIMEGVRGHKSYRKEPTSADMSDSEILRKMLEELKAIRGALEK